jgi:hypothetical protein
MKHQRPVLLAQDADEVDGQIGGLDLFGWTWHDCGVSACEMKMQFY